MGAKLNDVERLFVLRVTAGDSAGLAYARARTGDRRGRSDMKPTKADYNTASRWMARKEIAEAIKRRREKEENLSLWSKERFLQYLEGVLLADPRAVDEQTARHAQSYECTEKGERMTLVNKLGAAQLYAKCRGFEAPQQVEQDVRVGASGDLLAELGLSPAKTLPDDVMPL